MNPLLFELLQRQIRARCPDLTGGEASATIPASDRLLNEAIAFMLPSGGRIREVQLQSEDGNRLTARVRLSSPGFLPAIPVTFVIEEQPVLPQRPVLGLRLSSSSGLVAMAMSALSSFVTLPPGIAIEGERIQVDIGRLLAERNLQEVLDYVTDLRVSTRAGAVVIDVRAAVPQT
jgi:hypothetical protein